MISKLKNVFLVMNACIFCNMGSAMALEDSVKIGGLQAFQVVYYKNNGKPEQRVFSYRNREFGFSNSGHIFVDYGLVDEDDHAYGVKISLEHTAVNDRATPFSIYFDSAIGKIEAGADSSAGKKMRLTGYSASAGIGNGWNSFVVTSSKNPSQPSEKLVAYVTNFCSFLDSKTRTTRKSDYSRKITYFTPKIELAPDQHIQFGISYVPDSSNMGHDAFDVDHKNAPLVSVPYKFVIKDGISYGLAYAAKFSNDLSGNFSFAGEVGKNSAFNKIGGAKSDIKFKDLNTYVVGGELKCDKVSIAASYTNYNKSLTARQVDLIGRDTYAYGFGLKYNLGGYDVSVNQFNSDHKKSKLSASSIGGDYLVAKGLKTYAQATFYQTSGRYLKDDLIKFDKMKGFLFNIGAKISF